MTEQICPHCGSSEVVAPYAGKPGKTRHCLHCAGDFKMGELIELEYDGIFATCECGSDCWHIVVDKPGDFTKLEGIICAGCSDTVKFETTDTAA